MRAAGGLGRRGPGEVHLGQRTPVGLAVDVDRDGVEADHTGGDHDADEPLLEEGQQLLFGHLAAGFGRVIADQVPVAGLARPFPGHHGAFAHPRVCGRACLDLAGLHPYPVQLELEVAAAHELDLAGRQYPGQVTGAVQAGVAAEQLVLRRLVRVGCEPLGGQVVAVEVARGDTAAADVQLADGSDRQLLEVLAQHVPLHVPQRPADAAVRAGGDARAELLDGGDEGRLGEGVLVDHETVEALAQPAQPGRRQLLTDQQQSLQARTAAQVEVVQDRAGSVEIGHAVLLDVLREPVRVQPDVVGDDHQRLGVDERDQGLSQVRFEGVRGVERDPLRTGPAHVVASGQVGDAVDDAVVVLGDPLGDAGGA